MTPEAKVKAAIKKYLTKVGAWYCMPATGGFGKSGVPDFLVCHQGRFIGIEAKAPGKLKNTTSMQKQQLFEIVDAGGHSFICEDTNPLVEFFGVPA